MASLSDVLGEVPLTPTLPKASNQLQLKESPFKNIVKQAMATPSKFRNF